MGRRDHGILDFTSRGGEWRLFLSGQGQGESKAGLFALSQDRSFWRGQPTERGGTLVEPALAWVCRNLDSSLLSLRSGQVPSLWAFSAVRGLQRVA